MDDIARFERIVHDALKGAGDAQKRAQDEVLALRNTPEVYNFALNVLTQSNQDLAQFEALRIIKHSVLSDWGELISVDHAMEIGETVFKIVTTRKSSQTVFKAAASTIAVFFKRGWPVGPLSTNVNSDETATEAGIAPPSIIPGGNDEPHEDLYQSQAMFCAKANDFIDRAMNPDSEEYHVEFAFQLANELVNEFSASTASELKLLWEYHVKCHKGFERHALMGLFYRAISYLESKIETVALCQDSTSLEAVCKSLVRALGLTSRILEWEFEEGFMSDSQLLAEGPGAFQQRGSKQTQGGMFTGGRNAHMDAANSMLSVRPGPAWTNLLVGSDVPIVLARLYAAINTGNPLNPGTVVPPSESGPQSPEELFGRDERRNLNFVVNVSQKIYDVLIQLASVQGEIFIPTKSQSDVTSLAYLSQLLLITAPLLSRIENINAHLTMERDRRIAELRAIRQQQQAIGSSRSQSYRANGCLISEPQDASCNGVNGFGSIADELGFQACEVPVSKSYQLEVSELCRLFHRLSKNYPLMCLLFANPHHVSQGHVSECEIGPNSTFLDQLWQLTEAVLSPIVVAQFGAAAIDTWAAEAFDLLLDAWSSIATGMLDGSAASVPPEAVASLPYLFQVRPELESFALHRRSSTDSNPESTIVRLIERSMQPFFSEYADRLVSLYVRTRLAIAAEEALNDGDEVQERFHGSGSSETGTYFGDFLTALAHVARVNVDATLHFIQQEMVARTNTLREIANEVICQPDAELPTEQLRATRVCQEGLWWLIEFLSHVLVDDSSGEQPVIPTAMLYRSLAHYLTDCAEAVNENVIGRFIPEVVHQYIERLMTSAPHSVAYAQESTRSSVAVRVAESVCAWIIATNNEATAALQSLLPGDLSTLTDKSKQTDPLVTIMDCVVDYIQFEQLVLAESIKVDHTTGGLLNAKPQVLSPYVASALVRFLQRWSKSYLFPNEAFYSVFAPSLWAAFSNTPGSLGQRFVHELVAKVQQNLLLWGEEDQLSEHSCNLLTAMVGNTRVREQVIQSSAFSGLITAYKIASLSDPWFREHIPEILSNSVFPEALTSVAQALEAAGGSNDISELVDAIAFLVPLRGTVLSRLTQALATAAGYADTRSQQKAAIVALCSPVKLRLDTLLQHPLLQEDCGNGSEDDLAMLDRHLKQTLYLLRGLARSMGNAFRYVYGFLSQVFALLPHMVRHLGQALPAITLQILKFYEDLAATHVVHLSQQEAILFLGSSSELLQNFFAVYAESINNWASTAQEAARRQDDSGYGIATGIIHHDITGDDEDEDNDEKSSVQLSYITTILQLLKSISARQSFDLSDLGFAEVKRRPKNLPPTLAGRYNQQRSAKEPAHPFARDDPHPEDETEGLLTLMTVPAHLVESDPAKIASSCVGEGLSFISPLVGAALVDMPVQCHKFFDLLSVRRVFVVYSP